VADMQKRKIVITGALATVLLAVCLLVLVLPAIRQASAQEAAGAPGAKAPATPKKPAKAKGPKLSEQPMEPSRANPFAPVQARKGAGVEDYSAATAYGPNFSNYPITLRVPFPRPETPKPEELAPKLPPEVEYRRLSAVLWAPDGGVTAVLEMGEPPNVSSKIVKPGDVFDDWQVVEIQNDRVILRNRSNGQLDTIELQTEKEAPRPRRRQPQMQPGVVPGAPPAGP